MGHLLWKNRGNTLNKTGKNLELKYTAAKCESQGTQEKIDVPM